MARKTSVQVNYATSNGTAINGVDYTNVTGTLTFNTGDTSKTFTVPIISGTTLQPDKTVNLQLLYPVRRGDAGADQRRADHRQQ